MATYYDRLTGGISAGAYLDVYSVTTSATQTTASIAGGWHTFGGAWYVEYIDNSLGYFEGGNDHPLVASSGNRVWGAYDEEFNSTTAVFNRGASDRTIELYSYIYCYVNGMNRDARATCNITVPHLPVAPTGLTATRVTDNSVALSWTAPTRTADGIALEVQIDGGSWSEFATIASGTSYVWNGASADHSYKFRARTSYKGAWSDYTAATAAVVMTPAAPTSISTAAAGGTTVDVTLVNSSPVATSVEYQVSTDGGSTWGASSTSANLTSFSVTISGTGKIRVRNVNATGSSAWLVSETVTTICPPAAPTPRSPSGIVDMDAANVTFGWLFNSIDGSAQTAYELKYARNGGAATTLTGTTAKSRDVAMTTFSAGDSVSWQVRTKGADPNWSEWSSSQTFYVYTAPTVSITAPGATITGMPINLTAVYSDMPGFTCAAATASLTQGGRKLYSEPADINGSAITASLDVAELLPTNGESYTVVLDVRSSSSLQGTANATFLVDFTEPAAGTLQVDNDGETGYVNLVASFDNHATDVTYDGTAGTGVEVHSEAVRSLTVDGNSIQDGTPTPSNPVPIQTVSGVNLLNITAASTAYYTVNANGSVTFSGSVSTVFLDLGTVDVKSGETYHLSGCPAGGSTATYRLYPSGKPGGWYDTGNGATFTATADETLTLRIGVTGSYSELVFWPMLTKGAAPLPYVPYGAIGLQVQGANLIDNAALEQGGFNTSGLNQASDGRVRTAGYFKLEGGATYTASAKSTAGKTPRMSISLYRVPDYTTARFSSVAFSNNTSTFTAPDGVVYGRMLLANSDDSRCTPSDFTEVMLSKSDTAQPYEPYYSSVTPIPLDGNVLASLPDGTKDVLTVDPTGHVTLTKRTHIWNMRDYVSDSDWRKSGSAINGYYLPKTYTPAQKKDTHGNAVCNMATAQNNVSSYFTIINSCYIDSGFNFNLDSSVVGSTVADFKSWLSSNDLYMLADLATYSTIDLGSITMPDVFDGAVVDVIASIPTAFQVVGYDGSADAVSISVLRVNPDGSTTQLLADGESGTGIVDKYAPLNTPYQYAVVTRAASQAVRTVYVDNELDSPHWFAYWGADRIARATWNPSGQTSISRPEKKRVHYVGREYPVSYDTLAIDQQNSMSWTLLPAEEADGFRELMRDGGRGVYKGCDGQVFHADFEYGSSADFWHITRNAELSLTITRIDGEQL